MSDIMYGGVNQQHNMTHNTSLSHANGKKTAMPSSWTATPVCFLLIMVISTTLNGTLLYVFARHQNLRTTFNLYVVNVLLANLVETLVQMPLNLAHYLHWLSATACPFYIYSAAVQAVVVCSHTLITLNRVWAVTAPVSYRKYHRRKVSLALCALVWLYVHAIYLPGFILSIPYYQRSVDDGCLVDLRHQFQWSMVVQFCLFKIPVCVVILCYPFIAAKLRARRAVSFALPAAIKPVENNSCKVVDKPDHVARREVSEIPKTNQSHGGRHLNQPYSQHIVRRRGGLLMLSLMTASMLIFWAPSVVYYTVVSMTAIDWPIFGQVANIFCLLETVSDPICFILALKDVRHALVQSITSPTTC